MIMGNSQSNNHHVNRTRNKYYIMDALKCMQKHRI